MIRQATCFVFPHQESLRGGGGRKKKTVVILVNVAILPLLEITWAPFSSIIDSGPFLPQSAPEGVFCAARPRQGSSPVLCLRHRSCFPPQSSPRGNLPRRQAASRELACTLPAPSILPLLFCFFESIDQVAQSRLTVPWRRRSCPVLRCITGLKSSASVPANLLYVLVLHSHGVENKLEVAGSVCDSIQVAGQCL